jgi:hypothetical protein
MVQRHEFIERTLFLIRKLLEGNLPKEATLNEMKDKTDELIRKFIK